MDPSNREQARAWDGDEGAYWAAHAEQFDRAVAAYHDRLLDAAALEVTDDPFPAGGYDVAISRMGATFFGDPNVGFANIARAVRPGGRLALLAWQGAGNNEWATSLTAALAGGRPLPTPPANVPGPFALADPSRARAPLTQAGFARSEIDGMREPMDIGSDVTEAFAFALGLLGWMLEGLDGDGRARALEALHATLAAHETANGVLYAPRAWLIRARRP